RSEAGTPWCSAGGDPHLHGGPQRHGRFFMSGPRYSVLATTALALIFAAPLASRAQEAVQEPAKDAAKQETVQSAESKQETGKYAAVPTGTPAAQPKAETPAAPAEGAESTKETAPGATGGSEPEQVDRLASLDPA